MNWMQIDRIVKQALIEDLGHRDITTDNLIPPIINHRAFLCQTGGGRGRNTCRRAGFWLLDPI